VLKSKADAEQKLVSALSSSGKGDVTSQFFRAASRTAVSLAYERTRALKRHIAAMKGEYTLEPVQTARRLSDGAATKMKVTFRKGPRTFDEELVDILSEDEIRAALRSILESGDAGAREQLKPVNMSHCSPRVFWNLVRNHHNSNAGSPTDVLGILHAMFPSADLSFLYSRPKKKSSKARENVRQAEAHMARKVAAAARQRERLAMRKAKMDADVARNEGGNGGGHGDGDGDGDDASSSSSSTKAGAEEAAGIVEHLETVADITGQAVAALLVPLGIKTIDDLANQDTGKLVMRSRALQRNQISMFIEDARQDVIVRCLGAIVKGGNAAASSPFCVGVDAGGAGSVAGGAGSVAGAGGSEDPHQLPLLDADTIPMVCVLQDAGIVAPRDLTLRRTPEIFQRIRAVIETARGGGLPVPTIEVTEALVGSWRLASWSHLGTRPWLTDYYYAGDDDEEE
jgi:hypothetical protein